MKKMLKKITDFIENINNKYKKNICSKHHSFFQFLPNNIFLLIIFLFFLLTFIPKVVNNEVVLVRNGYMNEKELIDSSLSYSFSEGLKSNLKSITHIELLVSKINKDNTSEYELNIFQNSKSIFKKEIKAKDYTGKTDHSIKIDTKKIEIDSDKSYKIEIKSIKTDKDNNIIFSTSDQGNLNLNIYDKSPLYVPTIIISILFVVLFCFINYLINNNKIKKENALPWLLFVYYLPILFIIPPMQVPDEVYHFYQSYNTSRYNFDHNIGNFLSSSEIKVPENMECLYYGNVFSTDNVYDLDKVNDCMQSTNKYTDYTPPSKLNNAYPVYYYISGFAIKIARIFTTSPLVLFYIGRLAIFLLSFFIFYKAYKIIPKYKELVLFVGSLPMFVQQLISYSYDGIVNASALLFIAIFLKFYLTKDKEKIDRRYYIVWFLLSFLFLYIKKVYFVLLFLLILVPKKNFKKKNIEKYLLLASSILLPFIFIYAVNNIFKATIPVDVLTPNEGVDSAKQIQYILNNPASLVGVAFNTLWKYRTAYLYEFIGVLGWLVHHLPICFYYVSFAYLFLTYLSNESILKKYKERFFVILICLASIGMIFGGMYLEWTLVGADIVEGVQGRYFIPLFIPLLIALFPNKKLIKIEKETVYTYINIMMLVLTVFLMITYY